MLNKLIKSKENTHLALDLYLLSSKNNQQIIKYVRGNQHENSLSNK